MAAMTAIHPSKREGALARAKRRLAALAMSTVDRFETYLRYAGASAVALGSDLAAFGAIMALGFDSALAAGLSYCVGIAVHWLISAQFVFAAEVRARGTRARSYQKATFLASALLGLSVTVGLVHGVTDAGVPAFPAKLLAVALSFNLVWFVRRTIVFAQRA